MAAFDPIGGGGGGGGGGGDDDFAVGDLDIKDEPAEDEEGDLAMSAKRPHLDAAVDDILATHAGRGVDAMLEAAFAKGRQMAVRVKLKDAIRRGFQYQLGLDRQPAAQASPSPLEPSSSSSSSYKRLCSGVMGDLPPEAWLVLHDEGIAVLPTTPTRPKLGVFYKVRPFVRTVSSAKTDSGTKKLVFFRDSTDVSFEPSAVYRPVLLDEARSKVLQYVYEDTEGSSCSRKSGRLGSMSERMFKLRLNKATAAGENRQLLSPEERNRVLCCRITNHKVKSSNTARSAESGITSKKSIYFVNKNEEIVKNAVCVMYR